MKRFIALAVMAVMTIGSAITVNAATFYDINDVPWEGAKEYINSASALNLMVGDTDASNRTVFRAKDRVTYCESMQIVYSILKNANVMENSNYDISKWKSSMQEAYIPEWAYPCVSYGLENEILLENDLGIFMKGEGINRDATRENVAVIFGKAIDHLSEVNQAAVLDFKDKGEVSITSIPYIDLLSRFSIIVGDDGNFNPKNYINRAEMAVISSKTYYKVKELKEDFDSKAETISGTVMLTDDGISSKTISVSENGSGALSEFTITSDVPVTNNEGYTKSYEDISIGDIVTVVSVNKIVTSVVIDYENEHIESTEFEIQNN